MSKLHRISARLRQQALRCYEILLCATLLAMALAVAAPSTAQEGDGAAVQCGNIQSSTAVMQR